MVKLLYYSLLRKQICPWCGKKWMWTRARHSIVKKYGEFELVCKCGKQWRVIPKEEGFEYIEI